MRGEFVNVSEQLRRLTPACRLVGEIGMEPPDFIGRSSDGTLEQLANPTLQDLVGSRI
jgi:hypothetical protein